MNFELKGVLFRQNGMSINAIFYNDHEAIEYKNFRFDWIKIGSWEKTNYEEFSLGLSAGYYIKGIRENTHMDNHFILLSDESILRTNIVDLNGGEITEVLRQLKYTDDRDDYYWKVRQWYDESKPIELKQP